MKQTNWHLDTRKNLFDSITFIMSLSAITIRVCMISEFCLTNVSINHFTEPASSQTRIPNPTMWVAPLESSQAKYVNRKLKVQQFISLVKKFWEMQRMSYAFFHLGWRFRKNHFPRFYTRQHYNDMCFLVQIYI